MSEMNCEISETSRENMPPTKPCKKIKELEYNMIGTIKLNKGVLPILKDITEHFTKNFPTEEDDHFFSHIYATKLANFFSYFSFYSELYEYLDINLSKAKAIIQMCYDINNPEANRTKEKFIKKFGHTSNLLKITDEDIMKRLSLLDDLECFRLNESMRCLNDNCNLASVVMAVSAVEHRLHKLIQKKNKKLYEQEFLRATLGGIIELFRKDTKYVDEKYGKLKEILPKKHAHLIEILNTYRIFSAHPMDEKISNQTAKSILTFSFLLVTDKELIVK